MTYGGRYYAEMQVIGPLPPDIGRLTNGWKGRISEVNR